MCIRDSAISLRTISPETTLRAANDLPQMAQAFGKALFECMTVQPLERMLRLQNTPPRNARESSPDSAPASNGCHGPDSGRPAARRSVVGVAKRPVNQRTENRTDDRCHSEQPQLRDSPAAEVLSHPLLPSRVGRRDV